MSGWLERRVRRLERDTSLGLPWGRPARDWTDEQLLAIIGAKTADDLFLLGFSTPDALFFGVPEKTLAEWVEANPPPGCDGEVVGD